jgi:hypothetical protein
VADNERISDRMLLVILWTVTIIVVLGMTAVFHHLGWV